MITAVPASPDGASRRQDGRESVTGKMRRGPDYTEAITLRDGEPIALVRMIDGKEVGFKFELAESEGWEFNVYIGSTKYDLYDAPHGIGRNVIARSATVFGWDKPGYQETFGQNQMTGEEYPFECMLRMLGWTARGAKWDAEVEVAYWSHDKTADGTPDRSVSGSTRMVPEQASRMSEGSAGETEVPSDAVASGLAGMPVKPDVEPQHVQVQYILIGFAGAITGKNITRTKDDAKKLAYEILDRARKGEDFAGLVRQYTDDFPPGICGMSGRGIAPGPGEYSRDEWAAALGNVGFAISPGNIGIADHDPRASPNGWLIIKRLK